MFAKNDKAAETAATELERKQNKLFEKIGELSLAVVAALQVIIDQVMYTFIFYYTGTVETIAFILYFLTILIASSLYKTRGILLTAFLAVCLHNGILNYDFRLLYEDNNSIVKSRNLAGGSWKIAFLNRIFK